MLRDTIVCSAITTDDPATTGSTLSSGMDPWLPVPVNSISQLSTAAIIAPSRKCSFPSSSPGMLCMPNTASTGQRSTVHPRSSPARRP